MFAILRNQNLKAVRQKKVLATGGIETVADRHSVETSKPDCVDIVQRALEQLDEDQRLPILLVSMEGLSAEEAAEILNVPRGTVLSRMHRGRKRMKEIIEREFPNQNKTS